ncbi:hypothetical protein T4D_5177, partial [Trichinella pseudospiralis]
LGTCDQIHSYSPLKSVIEQTFCGNSNSHLTHTNEQYLYLRSIQIRSIAQRNRA